MDFTDQDLIEAARMGGRNVLILGGGRSQGKSYFQDVFVDGKSFTPNEIDWVVIDEWKRKWFSNCVLMKSSSKQSRYVRVWRNK